MRRAIALVSLIFIVFLMTPFLVSCGKEVSEKKNTNSSGSSSANDTSDSSDVSLAESTENYEDTDFSEPDFDNDFSFLGGLSGTISVANASAIEKPVSVFNDTQSGGYDHEAAILRESIRNTADAYNIAGETYYISPDGDDFEDGTSPETAWQSLDALLINNYRIKAGDAVLFERGSVFRENSSILAISGVTYGAYGKGEKPCIYGSATDYARYDLWESSNKKNIWKMEFPQKDAGMIVFNYGESAGIKKSGLASMTKNGDFYHNVSDKILYLYCDKGNPGKMFKNIEIGTNQHLFIINGGVSDVTIDNLCFKYTGAHGITAYEKNHNITITNCELGWIGGSYQGGVTRFGNAIQFWDSCWDIYVANNWIYQVYDAGLTFQYSGSAGDGGRYHDIDFSRNLIEYCTYSIEFFTDTAIGQLKNISFSSNVMRFSGYGVGSQRLNSINDAHICGWSIYYGGLVDNFVIRDNVFDCSTTQTIDWASGSLPHSGLAVTGNTFYQKAYKNNPVMNFGTAGYTYALNQSELEAAIASCDSSPRLVKWLG